MSKPVTLSLDAMGGDRGPDVVIPGAALALERCPDIRFILYGDEQVLRPLVAAHPRVAAASVVRHCEIAVRMDDKPSQALRHGRRRSSMWRAIEAVKTGDADAAISAGNTGALMAMAKFCLRTMDGIDRPAIAAIWPTVRGDSIVLDVGATIGADTKQLVNFALLGGAMARTVLGLERPTVGLLNVGVEEIKGLDAVREANQILRESAPPSLDYHGFVEGDDIGYGTVDVVVTEGFSGNIALKTAEGTSKQLVALLRSSIERSFLARIGYLLCRPAINRMRAKIRPRAVGGVFLGLTGLVVKTHGGTDPSGFASAVELGYDMVRNNLLPKIAEDIARVPRSRSVGIEKVQEVDALS